MHELEKDETPEVEVHPNHEYVPMVILSPDSVPEDAQKCRELGTHGDVLRAQADTADDPAVSLASPTAAKASLAILVVEDNPLNQQLVSALLRGWGHRVDLANNGKEALLVHAKKPFDLILMDLQMPEMGGFEATSMILEREGASANKPLIIAMTASIVEGERELCMAAGMVDYLSKPFKVEMLATMLKKNFPSAGIAVSLVANKPSAFSISHEFSAAEVNSADGKFNYARAIANADAEVVRLIAAMFLEQAPTHLRKMRGAWESGDLAVLQRQAHSMTGLLGSFLAEPARCIAAEIDRSVRENKPLTSGALFDALEREIGELSPHLAAIAAIAIS